MTTPAGQKKAALYSEHQTREQAIQAEAAQQEREFQERLAQIEKRRQAASEAALRTLEQTSTAQDASHQAALLERTRLLEENQRRFELEQRERAEREREEGRNLDVALQGQKMGDQERLDREQARLAELERQALAELEAARRGDSQRPPKEEFRWESGFGKGFGKR